MNESRYKLAGTLRVRPKGNKIDDKTQQDPECHIKPKLSEIIGEDEAEKSDGANRTKRDIAGDYLPAPLEKDARGDVNNTVCNTEQHAKPDGFNENDKLIGYRKAIHYRKSLPKKPLALGWSVE